MTKKLGYIDFILQRKKTIESRWYRSRISPWDRVFVGDIIYFKNAGEKVTAFATVEKALQFQNLNKGMFEEIVEKYGDGIGMADGEYTEFYQKKRYCILMFLKDPTPVNVPFHIYKNGFGTGCAWMCINDIKDVVAA
ncbi:hypothetical protein HYV12_00615 [Candidatus Dojkabacteria bacterium]|nr:hypothetical protein [Candidatus Dojkabacteria bacterium]